MKRSVLIVGSIVALVVGTTAYAGNVHLKPPNKNPSFIDLGLALRASGALAGLGNGDVVIDLKADANATATCTNPGTGETQPPGQNPAPVTVSGTEAIPASEIKNGTVAFSVDTVAPASTITGAPGCPNPKWTEEITDLSFTRAMITVSQNMTTVLTAACTFSPATANGPVPAGNVDCNIQ